MTRKNKIILGIIAGLVFLLLIIAAYLSRTDNSASAQENYYGFSMPVCNEPIPIGEAYEETFDILRDTYEGLQDLRNYLTAANSQLSSAVAALSENEEVCDFAKCQPEIDANNEVLNTSPDIGLYIWPFGYLGFRLPMCNPKECVGQPCPDIEKYIDDIEGFKNGAKGSYELVKDIFNSASEFVTEDIKQAGELPGKPIRRPESAARKLNLARAWLHASIGEKRSCSLSSLERSRAAAGEMSSVFPMRCKDALEQGIYWPKPSSERCKDRCKEGPTDKCQVCINSAYSDTSSDLGKINYKIYGICDLFCDNEFTQECADCICCKEFRRGACVKKMSDEECLAFICGGSQYNYVCCEEQPVLFEGFEEGASGRAGAGGGY